MALQSIRLRRNSEQESASYLEISCGVAGNCDGVVMTDGKPDQTLPRLVPRVELERERAQTRKHVNCMIKLVKGL